MLVAVVGRVFRSVAAVVGRAFRSVAAIVGCAFRFDVAIVGRALRFAAAIVGRAFLFVVAIVVGVLSLGLVAVFVSSTVPLQSWSNGLFFVVCFGWWWTCFF